PIERLQEVLNNTNKMVNQSLMFIELSLANMSMRKIQTDTFITISMLETINTAIDEYPFQGNERTFVHWDPDQQTDFNYLGNLILTKHIFFNLIKNALYFIKAERKGEITIQLIQNGKENRVIFRDTAKGMDDETLSHLFESFYTNTQFGTGIGLAYCKMVMEAYEGDIVCHAEEGKLTEFTLIFPKLG
ncbi:MAG: HAMP domain-containing histidine kinase, partial [Proteobacteria bacterium]|nr:HAMP domain-containing histidine kinase [Pseudomonadota bacterium]